jgi:hypothetical protein
MKPDEPLPYDVAQMIGRAARAREVEAADLANQRLRGGQPGNKNAAAVEKPDEPIPYDALRPAGRPKTNDDNNNSDVNIRPAGNSAAAAMRRRARPEEGYPPGSTFNLLAGGRDFSP